MALLKKGLAGDKTKGVIIPLSTGGNKRYYQCWTRFPIDRFIARCQRRGIHVTIDGKWVRECKDVGYFETYFVNNS